MNDDLQKNQITQRAQHWLCVYSPKAKDTFKLTWRFCSNLPLTFLKFFWSCTLLLGRKKRTIITRRLLPLCSVCLLCTR